MGIRRRRKTLTNLLSTLERRVTTVELRPINLLTASQIAAANPGEEVLDEGPNSVVSSSAPNQYRPIVEGYYYSARVTGGKPAVELYFESDLGLEKDKTIRISGLNKLLDNGTAVDFDLSNDYKVVATDTPPWDGRNQYNGKRDNPVEGDGVTNTAFFTLSSGTEYSSRKTLIVRRRISTVEATTTTAKITFTSPTIFEEGQVVYVNMPEGYFFGIDGLFRIKESTDSYITYDFDAPIPEPINVTPITEELYVNAVAQSAIRDGATWIDTSGDTDIVYVWKDIRWVLLNSTTVEDDNINPSPVTDLEATSEDDTPPGAAEARSRVTLTWTAPTTNEDGSVLDDLVGYTIEFRQTTLENWRGTTDITGSETTYTPQASFQQGTPSYFRVRSRDSGGNFSTWTEVSHTPGVSIPTIQQPKVPTVTTYLGTIKISYDDLTSAGVVQSRTAKEIEVFFSDAPGFTPGPDNFYGTFPANAGSYIIIPGTELVDNTDYYVRIRVRDIFGNISAPSDPPIAIRAKLSDIVTFDMIDVGTLTGQIIVGLQLATNTNPSVNGGISINNQGIVAYAPPISGTPAKETFRINALTGGVTIGDYLGKTEAAGLFISKVTADLTYATIATANGINVVAQRADSVAAGTRTDLDNLETDFAAITSIEPGRIVVMKSDKVIGAINKGSGSANTSNTTTIEGGVIKAGTISVQKLTVEPLVKGGAAKDINDNTTTISGGKITTNTINVNRLIAGTLTGFKIQTSSSGKRILIDETNNRITFFSSDGERGRIEAGSGDNAVEYDARGPVAASHRFEVNGNFAASISPSGILLPNTATISTAPANGTINLAGNLTATGAVRGSFVRTGTGTVLATLHSGGSISTGNGTAPSVAGTIQAAASLRAGTTVVVGVYNTSTSPTANVRGVSGAALALISSDARLKDNIEAIPSGLSIVNQLKPVTYNSLVDEDDRKIPGFIAQDMEKVFDDSIAVVTRTDNSKIECDIDLGDDPLRSVEHMSIIPYLTKAIQELSDKNEALEARLQQLEGGQ